MDPKVTSGATVQHFWRFLETWLSWNGKRVRLESVKHCKQIESMGSLDKSERQRSLHEEEQCERIERSPRSKTPSL